MSTRPLYYSVSRLSSYNKCGEMFRLKYIEGIETESTTSTIKGTICHKVLELLHQQYSNVSISTIDIFFNHLSEVLGDDQVKIIPYPNLVPDLKSLYEDKAGLYIRASNGYSGKDAIRKGDGSVASHPEMTSSWKKAESKLNLSDRETIINSELKFLNPEADNFGSLLVECLVILSKYTIPSCITKTLYTEYPISEYREEEGKAVNEVKIPPQYIDGDDINLLSYIDWLGMTTVNGVEKLTIIDYKTNKSETNESQVLYNTQLNVYAYAIRELMKTSEIRVGIHQLRSNTLYLVDVDWDIVEQIVKDIFSNHLSIKNKVFKKHLPDSNYSPCLNMYGQKCPYLGHCYPNCVSNAI